MQHILFCRFLTITIDQLEQKPTTIKWLKNQPKFLTKGLFTWKWGTPGRWGNPLRWGNLPVRIIAHFNLITFTWYVGRPTKMGITVCQGNPLSWQQICHVNVSRWGYLTSWGQIRNTSNLGKIHFGGGFAALLKVSIDSNSTEGCSRSSKWVQKSINCQNTWFASIFLVTYLTTIQ